MISKLSHRLYDHQLCRFLSDQATAAMRTVLCCDRYSQNTYMELSQSFYEAMKECASLKSAPIAQKLHAQLISTGLHSSFFLQNHLLNMYSNCRLVDDACQIFEEIECGNVFTWNTMVGVLGDWGRIHEARKLFDGMPHRDSVSWNSMMSAYYINQKPEETIKAFILMIRDGRCAPDPFSFSCAVKACGCLSYIGLALQLHGFVVKFNFGCDDSVGRSILDMYIKCGVESLAEQVFMRMQSPSLFCWNSMISCYSKSYGVEKALELFNRMPERDEVSWNTIISVLSRHGRGDESLSMFIEMCSKGFRPSSVTYASVLSACASISDLEWGLHFHARMLRAEPNLDVSVGCVLIDMYAKCGRLEFARHLFDSLRERNAVAWTSLISGLAQFGHHEEALALFKKMKDIDVPSDEFTIATALGLCSNQGNMVAGIQLHSYAIKAGMESSVPVGNAIITMYAKSGDIQKASRAFAFMPVRDNISWTAMITSFSQTGDVEKARHFFNKMPDRNVISWNSMISTYIRHGFVEDGLKLYLEMRREGVNPDWVTFASSISACADLATLRLGKQIVTQSEKLGFSSNISVANTIVTMYSRCGEVQEARKVFDSIRTKNMISWNSMMAGYAQNGQGKEVIKIFEDMLKTDCAPDHISYVSVLSGCSYSGLVPEGRHHFDSMTRKFGISPTYEHYSSMVSLFGRAGFFKEAMDVIRGMTFKPNADIWVALLSSCRIHRIPALAEYAMRRLIDLDLKDSGSYVLLANTYLDAGQLEGVADVRKLMREKEIRKNPGCSWVEINDRVHVFTVAGTDHPQTEIIHKTLKEISKMIEDTMRYVCSDNRANAQSCHSEKLPAAIGLDDPTWSDAYSRIQESSSSFQLSRGHDADFFMLPREKL